LKELDWNFGDVHGTETDVGGFMSDFKQNDSIITVCIDTVLGNVRS
jgi:hypothetical protein